MAQVEKRIAITANVSNAAGEFAVNGEIPAAWTDFIGAHGTMLETQGWVASVARTGANELTVRSLRRDGVEVEPVPQSTQVTVLLTLVGTD